MSPVARSNRRLFGVYIAGRSRTAMLSLGIVCFPACFARDPLFISHPANIRTDVAENNCFRLKLAYQRPSIRPIVVTGFVDDPFLFRAAVVPRAAVRAIVPDFKNRAVLRK